MGEKQRIVVLDDNEVFAALMVAALEPDYDVAVGTNGLQGIALCLESHTDLVLADIGMPEFDGIQMLKEFRKDRRLSGIPVVIVTATHFTTRSRADVECYPQVRGIISKTSGIDFIILEARRALQTPGGPGPAAQ